jgi:phosphatidylinositol alpha 1,6-mannosyltransferase
MRARRKLAARHPFLTHPFLTYFCCYRVTLTIRKLEQEILNAGHHVCVLTTRSGDMANTNLDGSHPNRNIIFLDNAKPIPFLNDPNQPDLAYQLGFGLSATVRRQLDEFEPSIVHITCPDCTALHVIQYARLKEIPIMGTYHSNIPEYMEHYPGLSWLKHILSCFFRHQYNFLQALYVPTPYIQKHLEDNHEMDKVTSLQVWGRGVDIDRFNPSFRSLKYRRDLGIGDDTVVISWVGRLVPEKRVDIFADTVRRLSAQGLNVHALVVGAGPAEEDIKSLPNTTFAGWMNADQLAVAYASCDVFLFPSSVETFGNVTLEAMASGLPVVVEQGCSGHLVRHGENGYACQAGDADAFFECTRDLVVDQTRREAFRETSRNMSLSLEKRAVVRRMLDHYTRVTDEFYMEYGGHHANRDQVYRHTGSFRAGSHPRPLILVFIEYLFIVLFQVIWNMTEMFLYMQQALGSVRPPPEVTRAVATPPVSPIRASVKKASSEPYPERNDTGLSIVNLETIRLVDDAEDSLLGEESTDGDTHTTNSFSHESASDSRYGCCVGGEHQAFGDCQLSHTLSKSFIRTVEFQCRMESRIRNGCNTCCTMSLLPSRKRKNSMDSYQNDEMPLRTRSSEPETEVPVCVMEGSQALQPKRVMRRNQNVTMVEV